MLVKTPKGATSMKRAMYLAILLCSVILTGCYDDYAETEMTAVSQSETVSEAIAPVTEGISSEATTYSSDMVPTMTDAPEDAWTDAEETAMPPEEAETFPAAEPTEPALTEAAETTAEPIPTTTMTETTTSAEPTAPAETEQITETETMTEPTEPERSDYDKALEVYEYMLENGHGTCVNYACQTYEKCQEVGLPCYIVWTDAQLYAHVANTVQVEGIWFILDTQGQKFLTYNNGFTEVIDMEMHHIGDADMLSAYRYDELFG